MDPEEDHPPPIGILLFGESFLKAAEFLQESIQNGPLRLRFDAPVYQLLTHSIELMLKAYLRAQGISAEDLRVKYGHGLQKLYAACGEAGLILSRDERVRADILIDWVGQIGKLHDFRYFAMGYKQYPGIQDLERLGRELFAAIRPHCDH
jgi:hypothetical protein